MPNTTESAAGLGGGKWSADGPSNASPFESSIPAWEKVLEAGSLGLICVTAVVSNVSLWFVVLTSRSLRNESNYLILCLSMADLLVSVVSMPITVATIVSAGWIFSDKMCTALGYINMLAFVSSVESLGVISINRYVKICHPSLFVDVYTTRSAVLMSLGVWLLSGIMSLPPLFGWATYSYLPLASICFCDWPKSPSYAFFMIACCFCVPCGIMMVCYIRILRAFQQSRKTLQAFSQPVDTAAAASPAHSVFTCRHDTCFHKEVDMSINRGEDVLVHVSEESSDCDENFNEEKQTNSNRNYYPRHIAKETIDNHDSEDGDRKRRRCKDCEALDKLDSITSSEALSDQRMRGELQTSVSSQPVVDKDKDKVDIDSHLAEKHQACKSQSFPTMNSCDKLAVESCLDNLTCETHINGGPSGLSETSRLEVDSFKALVTQSLVPSTYGPVLTRSKTATGQAPRRFLRPSRKSKFVTHHARATVPRKLGPIGEDEISNFSSELSEPVNRLGVGCKNALSQDAKIIDVRHNFTSSFRRDASSNLKISRHSVNFARSNSPHNCVHRFFGNLFKPGWLQRRKIEPMEENLSIVNGESNGIFSTTSSSMSEFPAQCLSKQAGKGSSHFIFLAPGKNGNHSHFDKIMHLPKEKPTSPFRASVNHEQGNIGHKDTKRVTAPKSRFIIVKPTTVSDADDFKNTVRKNSSSADADSIVESARNPLSLLNDSNVAQSRRQLFAVPTAEDQHRLLDLQPRGKQTQIFMSPNSAGNFSSRIPTPSNCSHAKQRSSLPGKVVTSERRRREEIRLTTSLLVVVFLFIVCWFPYCISMFMSIYRPDLSGRALDMTALLLGYMNSCVNPIVYGLMNKRFKEGYRKLFTKCRICLGK
ncbi:hypothetical protein RRG08_025379 [Elysia crispata]|uniref:G-protein coupled receptors family 1 profile domain-containing protein n=1 Tax=Elysia crispata TaxID=231223 RepID=A0AAE1B4K7_9GAST|nr:hypothetical protein RRG08_025379 [Elysia crispata]